MKRSWKNFRIDKNKVYMRIGQAVVYSSLYIHFVFTKISNSKENSDDICNKNNTNSNKE